MANILPFRAVRPTRDKVGLIASRPYYSKSQREARLDTNPYSFLHIVNPGYKYEKEILGKERFNMVKNRYEEFKEEKNFIQDDQPCYYLHKIINRENEVFQGIIGAADIGDYKSNHIKKHESTLTKRIDTFKEYLNTVGFNAEPVLLTHPDNLTLQAIFEDVSSKRAEYEFTTTYRDTHYFWIINDSEIISKIKDEFAAMETMYIADGHHRSASSYRLAEEKRDSNPNHTGKEPYNYFMVYNIPESQLKIHEFNRLVKDLNGLNKEEFLIQLDAYYRIENRGYNYYKPSKKTHFSMYLDGEFYSLYLRKHKYKPTDSLSELDVQILYKTILKPILGIKNLKNNNRLAYAHGKNDLTYIKGKVDSENYAVGFGLVPIEIEEVKEIAEDDLRMPPKATYIEPKLRSGITIYEL